MENFFVCDMLFRQFEKPQNFDMCKAINVYDNKYRINVYTEDHDEFYDIKKKRITQSFFAKLEKDALIVLKKEGKLIKEKT